MLPSLRLSPALSAKAPGPNSQLPSEGSGGGTRLRPPLPFETQRANSALSTFLASLPVCLTQQRPPQASTSEAGTPHPALLVCLTRRRPPQKPALLTPAEVTENDVSALTHTREGADWADGGPPLHGFPRRRAPRKPLQPVQPPQTGKTAWSQWVEAARESV